jgi:hypothetical protein
MKNPQQTVGLLVSMALKDPLKQNDYLKLVLNMIPTVTMPSNLIAFVIYHMFDLLKTNSESVIPSIIIECIQRIHPIEPIVPGIFSRCFVVLKSCKQTKKCRQILTIFYETLQQIHVQIKKNDFYTATLPHVSNGIHLLIPLKMYSQLDLQMSVMRLCHCFILQPQWTFLIPHCVYGLLMHHNSDWPEVVKQCQHWTQSLVISRSTVLLLIQNLTAFDFHPSVLFLIKEHVTPHPQLYLK